MIPFNQLARARGETLRQSEDARRRDTSPRRTAENGGSPTTDINYLGQRCARHKHNAPRFAIGGRGEEGGEGRRRRGVTFAFPHCMYNHLSNHRRRADSRLQFVPVSSPAARVGARDRGTSEHLEKLRSAEERRFPLFRAGKRDLQNVRANKETSPSPSLSQSLVSLTERCIRTSRSMANLRETASGLRSVTRPVRPNFPVRLKQ